jgi:hypothetical protein
VKLLFGTFVLWVNWYSFNVGSTGGTSGPSAPRCAWRARRGCISPVAIRLLRRARGVPAERRWLREADLGVELAARVAVTTTLAASTGAIVLP